MDPPALISVIDDDEDALEAIARLIRLLGFEVRTFTSAAIFLASSSVLKSDCIVTDLRMPGMNGVELLNRLAGLGPLPPTIIVTAHPEDAVRLTQGEGEPVCVLSKPFDADALESCLTRALSGSA